MIDRKKEDPVIELTDVVEEGPGPAEGQWMETTPAPPTEKKAGESPGTVKKADPKNLEDLRAIPDSPLRKFLMAEEGPSSPAASPTAGKSPEFSPPTPQPRSATTEPQRMDMEAEMRALREAMLARIEKWVNQEGVQVVERVAREVFPKIAEDLIRKEIEKMKAEAEQKE